MSLNDGWCQVGIGHKEVGLGMVLLSSGTTLNGTI